MQVQMISHASLDKRGLSRGAANASAPQMFHESEHRLVLPFSLKHLQCTVDGKNIPQLKKVLDEASLEERTRHDDGAQPADYCDPFGRTRGESGFTAGGTGACQCTRRRLGSLRGMCPREA